MFHFLERLQRHHMAVVIQPATNDRVEQRDQFHLTCPPVLTHQLPHFFQEGMRVLFGGPDNQLAVKLTEVLPEEVEALTRCASS